MTTKLVLVDLDGTVADCSRRAAFLPDYKKFYTDVDLDFPYTNVIDVVNSLHTVGWRVVFVSGRTVEVMEPTVKWLKKYFSFDFFLFMREEKDYRKDAQVKEEIYLEKILPRFGTPNLVIDDNPSVISVWKKYGLTVLAHENSHVRTPKLVPGTHLVLMVGPSRAGKTTYCRKFEDTYDVISSDKVRKILNLDHTYLSNVKVFDYIHNRILLNLQKGIHTVVDSTNLVRKNRMKIISLTNPETVVKYVVINRNLPDKLATREEVPEEVIIAQHALFEASKTHPLNGDGMSINVEVVGDV